MFAKLVALNEEARRALNGVQIEIERFPFKVGRESRGFLSRASMSIERRLGSASPLNDVYLSASAADGPRISREHFLIDRTPEGHYLVDRASTDGTVVNGVLWVLRTGCPWRDLLECYGPWQTVYSRFVRWRREGVWMRIWLRLLAHANATGRIAWSGCGVDGTYVRAHQHAAGAPRRANPQDEKGGSLPSQVKRWGAVAAA